VDTQVPMHDTGDLCVHTPNAVVNTAVVHVANEGAVPHAQDLVVHTKERLVHARKRVLHAKHPGVHKQDLGVDQEARVQDNGVLVQDEPAAPKLRENPFLRHFFLRVMHEGKKDVLFSIGVMHEEKSEDAKEKSTLAALRHKLTKVFSKAADVFSKDTKEFCRHTKSLGKPTSNVRRHTPNGMQQEKNVRKLAKEFSRDTKDCRKLAKEFSKVGKKLRVPAKSPGKLVNFLRKVGKILRKLADVISQEHSAAPRLAENRFMHTFFSRIITGKKSRIVFFFRSMHEGKGKDAFSAGRVHPPSILHTSSAFVPKQGAFVSKPASAVENDDAMQRTAVAGRETGTAGIQQFAMRASYGAVVSPEETPRRNFQMPKPCRVLDNTYSRVIRRLEALARITRTHVRTGAFP